MVAWADGDSLDYYALKVVPGKERMACDILANRKILSRVPIKTTQTIEKINRRTPPKVIERKSPLLVGLVFVAFPKFDDTGKAFEPPWFALRKRIHIIRGFLGSNNVPTRFDQPDKDKLLRLFDDIVFTAAEVAAHIRTYRVGERVRVTMGPFAGFDAEVTVISPERGDMEILCDIFGRRTPVRIEPMQLDKIESVAA